MIDDAYDYFQMLCIPSEATLTTIHDAFHSESMETIISMLEIPFHSLECASMKWLMI